MSERRKPKVVTPLFGMIDQYPAGMQSTRENDRIRVIARGDRMLSYFGVHPDIVRGVRDAALLTRPMAQLVVTREPRKTELALFEGRGHRHPDIPISIGGGQHKDVTVYVKGGGNKDTLKKARTPRFPGFPDSVDELMYDKSRVKGTATVTWELIEMINAATLFAGVSKKYGWTSLEQALDAEMTIPLHATHFPELSEHVRDLVQQKKDITKDQKARDDLDWRPNQLGVGTLTQIVPGTTRLFEAARDFGLAEKTMRKKWSEPETARTMGRTLHELFDAGFVYSMTSAHGQNLYERGLVAHADSADLVFLGDVSTEQYAKEPLTAEQKRWQHTFLLFKQLLTNNEAVASMTPYIYPEANKGWSFDKAQASQKIFWSEMLKGYAHPDAVDALVTLMPYMQREILAAISATMVDGVKDNVPEWEALSVSRRELMEKYKEFQVTAEYDDFIADEIPVNHAQIFRSAFENEKLSHLTFMYFLQTGDIADLLEDRKIKDMYELAKAIESVKQESVRERLMRKAGTCFNNRPYEGLRKEPDNLASFEGIHAVVVTDYVAKGEYKKAEAALSVLTDSVDGNLKKTIALDGRAEQLDHYYLRRLLVEDPVELDRELLFVRKILDVSKYVKTDTRDLFISQLTDWRESQPDRDQITKYIDKLHNLIGLRGRVRTGAEIDAMKTLAERLGREISRVDDIYPGLMTLYGLMMRDAFSDLDFGISMEYHKRSLPGLARLQAEYVPKSEELEKASQREVSDMYAELGFPFLARRYQALADGEVSPDLWQTEIAA